MNIKKSNLNKCDSHKTYVQQQRLSDALKLVEGVSRLPLRNNAQKAAEIRQVYGVAENREKK